MFKKKTAENKKKSTVKSGKTQVLIYYDVGFSNSLYIRGEGGGLSWDQGKQLKNAGSDLWIWETTTPLSECEFKVLINDERYELGENHRVTGCASVQYTPQF